MTIVEAKQIIFSEPNAPIFRLIMATSELISKNNANDVSCHDLLECLRRGIVSGKVTEVSELAALGLYTRTGRKRKSWIPYEDFDLNPESWESFLKEHNFL